MTLRCEGHLKVIQSAVLGARDWVVLGAVKQTKQIGMTLALAEVVWQHPARQAGQTAPSCGETSLHGHSYPVGTLAWLVT